MTNPYAPPAAVERAPADAGAVRAAHIFAEEWIRTLGTMLLVIGALATLLLGVAAVATRGSRHVPSIVDVLPAFGLAAAACGFGWMLRRLQPVAQVMITLAAGAFVVMTLLNNVGSQWIWQEEGGVRALPGMLPSIVYAAHVPWMLWNRAGRRVFSAEYRGQVVPATPQVRSLRARVCVVGITAAVILISFVA